MPRPLIVLSALIVSTLLSTTALADAPISLGAAGQVERAGMGQDARKNPTGASFGSPVSDDRRLFVLRWRLPWLAVSGTGPSPFSTGFVPFATIPGGLSLASEPMTALSSLVPQGQIGEANKLGRVQFGALSYSLGHGTAVDRFTNSPDGTSRRFGLLGELNLAGLAGHLAVADILDGPGLVSARVAGRPLMWFLAPDATFQPNELDIDPRTEVLGMWQIALAGAADTGSVSSGFGMNAGVLSLENEAALLDNQLVKFIPYVDVNALQTTHEGVTTHGYGVHPGIRAMLDVAGSRFEADVEANAGTDGYSPRYFDRLYFLERDNAFGSGGKAKAALLRPSSWGFRSRLDVSVLETFALFGELRDQRLFADAVAPSQMQATVGASMFLLMAGGSIIATQTGIGDNDLFGPGFVVTAEGRVALLLNVVHVVARAWQAHVPGGDDPGEFLIERGMTAGVEVNFDLF